MKNSLRVLTVSPVVILGMLTSLSLPVRAESITGGTVGAPSLPSVPDVPSVDDLTPEPESAAPETPADPSVEAEAPAEAAPTASEAPAEVPSGEPTAIEEAPVETEPTASEGSEGTTIVDVAGSDDSFSTLVGAIEAAGLKESLMADGTFTVFAPTNAAFESLPPGVLEQLLQPENKQVLTQVLMHHVLTDEKMAADLSTESVTSLANSALQIKVDDAGVGIDNAKVIQADIDASNGVIHAIDQVLIPQELLRQPAPAGN